jgi:hypothetical protein
VLLARLQAPRTQRQVAHPPNPTRGGSGRVGAPGYLRRFGSVRREPHRSRTRIRRRSTTTSPRLAPSSERAGDRRSGHERWRGVQASCHSSPHGRRPGTRAGGPSHGARRPGMRCSRPVSAVAVAQGRSGDASNRWTPWLLRSGAVGPPQRAWSQMVQAVAGTNRGQRRRGITTKSLRLVRNPTFWRNPRAPGLWMPWRP